MLRIINYITLSPSTIHIEYVDGFCINNTLALKPKKRKNVFTFHVGVMICIFSAVTKRAVHFSDTFIRFHCCMRTQTWLRGGRGKTERFESGQSDARCMTSSNVFHWVIEIVLRIEMYPSCLLTPQHRSLNPHPLPVLSAREHVVLNVKFICLLSARNISFFSHSLGYILFYCFSSM